MSGNSPNFSDMPDSSTEDESLESRKDQQDGLVEDSREVDVMDLVYKGGYTGNPREIVDNPAVAPQMMNLGQVDADNRDDMMSEDADADDVNQTN
jgi:hypothetical protein